MDYDEAADRLVTEARELGLDVVRIDPAVEIHSAEDITLVNPTGSTIGFIVKDITSGRHHFVPIDGPLRPSPGSGGPEPTDPPPGPVVIFRSFCPAQHDERFGGTLVEGNWWGAEHSTLGDAESEAGNHNATTGHAAFAKRFIEA